MELSCSNIKNILYFLVYQETEILEKIVFQEMKTLKSFLYFGKWNFSAQARQIKLSSSNIETFLIFSQKKAFLIFQKTETLKNSYISGGTPKNPEIKISDISPKTVMNKFF